MVDNKYVITRDELLDVLQGRNVEDDLDLFIEVSQNLKHDEKVCIILGENPEKKGIEGEFLATAIGKAIKNCLYGNGKDVDLMDCYKHSWCFGGDVKQQGNERELYLTEFEDYELSSQRIWHSNLYAAGLEDIDYGPYIDCIEHDFCDNPYLDICSFYSVKDDANKFFDCVCENMDAGVYIDLMDIFAFASQKLQQFTYEDVFGEDDFIANIDKYKEFLTDKLMPMCEAAIMELKNKYRESDDYARRITMGLDVEQELDDLFAQINVYKDIVLIDGSWIIKHNVDEYKLLLPEEVFSQMIVQEELCTKKNNEREL